MKPKNKMMKITPHKEALSIYFRPGECEQCPAGAGWDSLGSGLWCFAGSYFLALNLKDKTPRPCERMREKCPLLGHEELYE